MVIKSYSEFHIRRLLDDLWYSASDNLQSKNAISLYFKDQLLFDAVTLSTFCPFVLNCSSTFPVCFFPVLGLLLKISVFLEKMYVLLLHQLPNSKEQSTSRLLVAQSNDFIESN